MTETKLSCFWQRPNLGEARTGVSLHGHTNRSKESLYFIPQLARKIPMLDGALEKRCAEVHTGVDFKRAYWTPPLNPKAAYELEKGQIENTLGSASLVSLTDHDSIEAPSLLRAVPETANIPVSLEWSVPFGGTIFHLGVHNLPPGRAQEIVQYLVAYKQNPSDDRLVELLAMLDEIPDALVVFNHPMWNQSEVGEKRESAVLDRFLKSSAQFLHAIEFNATRRPWENRAAHQIAKRWLLPLVSGGDRHGCEASGALNITRAQSFPEFVNEIRKEKCSHILVMSQYNAPHSLRIARTLLDVIRDYPEFPEGSRRWDQRVFHPDPNSDSGELRPVSELWGVPPAFIEHIFSGIRLLENDKVQRAWQLLFAGAAPAAVPSESSPEAVS
jgi:hypothetical protein